MTPVEKAQETRFMRKMMAEELESHLANGSEWVFNEPDGESSPPDVVRVRVAVLRQEVRRLRRLAQKGSLP